jgi:SWI/SNF-related matrix-associated actin-dependent regulator of chromatin subfamily A-like protein 1
MSEKRREGVRAILNRELRIEVGPSNREVSQFLHGQAEARFIIEPNVWEVSPSLYLRLRTVVSVADEPPRSLVLYLAKLGEEKTRTYVTEGSEVDEEIVTSLHNKKSGETIELFLFQIETLYRARILEYRMLIADDMGLGKTFQALALVQMHARTEKECRVIVLAPAGLCAKWTEDFESFIDLQVEPLGTTAERFVTIISYDQATKKTGQLRTAEYTFAIADESHSLKNPRSQRGSSIPPFLASVPKVILLTGTPVLSLPIEAYTQLNVLRPIYTQREYEERYCRIDPKREKSLPRRLKTHVLYTGRRNLDELQIVLERLIMIRREKRDVLALPKKKRIKVLLSSSPISTETELLMDYSLSVAEKIERTVLYLRELRRVRDEKLIVFAHHREMLDRISLEFPDSVRIDGSTDLKERNRTCRRFQEESGLRLAVLSITTCSVGVTLTSSRILVFAELYWNPGILLQAEDRIYRIGQSEAVEIHYLIGSSFDRRVWPLVQRKMSTLEAMGMHRDKALQISSFDFSPEQRYLHL